MIFILIILFNVYLKIICLNDFIVLHKHYEMYIVNNLKKKKKKKKIKKIYKFLIKLNYIKIKLNYNIF